MPDTYYLYYVLLFSVVFVIHDVLAHVLWSLDQCVSLYASWHGKSSMVLNSSRSWIWSTDTIFTYVVNGITMDMRMITSWFKLNDGNYLPHECRMQQILYSNVTYFVSYWPPWTVEEGDVATFFVQDLGLALAAKTCPHRPQAFKTVNNGQAFPWEEKFDFPVFIWTSRFQVPQGNPTKSFAQMFEHVTA